MGEKRWKIILKTVEVYYIDGPETADEAEEELFRAYGRESAKILSEEVLRTEER